MEEIIMDKDKIGLESDKHIVPALYRGLGLLEKIAEHPEGAPFSLLVQETGLPTASVYRMAETLEKCGYVKHSVDRRYRISRKLLKLGSLSYGEHSLVERAMPFLRKARDLSGETVLLGVLNGQEGIVLTCVDSPQAVKVSIQVGHHFPLHTAAPAKAILAMLPEDELSTILKSIVYTRFTAATITSEKAFLRELAAVKKHGLAFDRGEELDDLRCIAAPILNEENYPVAAVWCSGPASRFNAAKEKTIAGIIQQTAREIGSEQ